jgi:hypothetical protein
LGLCFRSAKECDFIIRDGITTGELIEGIRNGRTQ